MERIGQYTITQHLKDFNENLTSWSAEDASGQAYEVLTIKQNSNYQHLVERIFRNEIIPLANQEIEGVQRIITAQFDATQQAHYIVYNYYDDLDILNKSTLMALRSLLVGLDNLKKLNRFGNVIFSDTILANKTDARLCYVGLFELFKQQNLLDSINTLAPEVVAGSSPGFQSDMFSVFKSFDNLLENSNDETLRAIFAKATHETRIERYARYNEVIEALEKVKTPIDLQSSRSFIKVVVPDDKRGDFEPVVREMNFACHFLMDDELSKKGENLWLFSTKSYSGKLLLDNKGYLYLLYRRIKCDEKVLKDGFTLPYSYDFNPPGGHINCYKDFFFKRPGQNNLAKLSKTKQGLIKTWQTLPKQEKAFIEEMAFKAKYVSLKEDKRNSSNIKFKLVEEFRSWDKIKELKRNHVNLSIDEKIIGTIHDYDTKNCILVIKDANTSLDEIPDKGELIQDVRMETAQYKKQVEACKKFESKDIVNPALSAILATPNTLQPQRILIDYNGFDNQIFNNNTDPTQRESVLEALHRKPVYLIQGPPGTGKTTVIVELIKQIIKNNRNTKILVTSQSNLAVDNVFEKLLPDSKLFMRLAADEDKISVKIKPHSFKTKLSNWVAHTNQKATSYLDQKIKSQSKDKALLSFYTDYLKLLSTEENNFDAFIDRLRIQRQHIKSLFDKARNYKQVDDIFNDKLGTQFQQLRRIQKDWFAFLNNIGTEEDSSSKSMLKDGSSEVDLQTALVKSVNVIGATCIHIASGQYNKINFRFDYVIMDESSKATPAETLVPINMGHQIILIGDHKQLPPVITREVAVKRKVKEELDDEGLDFDKAFGDSLFEKLITDFEANIHLQSHIKMLDVQYRMPRQIGNLIGRFFYDNKLNNPSLLVLPDFDQDKWHGLTFKKPITTIRDTATSNQLEVPTSVVFVSTSKLPDPYDNDNKLRRNNQCNKKVIEQILQQLNELYPDNLKNEQPFTIGIIAGYRGQVELLRRIDIKRYENFVATTGEPLIEINTVDQFQGAERDIIIYDIVKSSRSASSIGFLDDYRRINVAFSRVKKLLIVVGDSEYILKRAQLNPDGKFKDFKLKDIVAELDRQGVIVNSLKDMIA